MVRQGAAIGQMCDAVLDVGDTADDNLSSFAWREQRVVWIKSEVLEVALGSGHGAKHWR